ncbi:hypothetical protein BOW91_gp192 [Synechococcus phage S-WAM2]|uniref:Uncharacterized protein n=1 Tax=Synechococcus phage S-WAM2 TaxID=1815522 RepID=A0A1D8KT84_9CAUD|nr:hypothetical protein BOW91_gp192 [Synechococcus phage S-WAM2]AOV61754.1 hypothetical protein P29B0810_059 [Synechococcus phage S-WAM2]
MSIPDFQTEEHQKEFEALFEQKAQVYINMMNKVMGMMYGSSTVYNNLPGKCQEVLRDITQSLIYDAEYAFKAAHPEYKNGEDELFIPYRSFKENVLEALNEALTPYELQYKNECDTLACADHLTDD